MSKIKLTIQSGGRVFEPPVEDGVQLERDMNGSPGRLTFTTIKVHQTDMSFHEGDRVYFHYDGKLVFMGYVFKKKRDREHRIEVTCYDQIRYLKNKYTYVFEKKTASQIISALCSDYSLNVGSIDNTGYVIPEIAEENKAALDIILNVLEETLVNTGNRYVLYDDCGDITIKNCANMVSSTLIFENSAENFDYTSSIDDETYNQVVLYYKDDDNKITLYESRSDDRIDKWGVLRYFEETKNKTSAQSKANSLLKLYNKKTRALKVTGAFGDTSVRGGTLIPVQLDLGDVIANNYMVVEKVTHNFECDHYTMDLTLYGSWEDDYSYTMTSSNTEGGSSDPDSYTVSIECNGINHYAGMIRVDYVSDGKSLNSISNGTSISVTCDKNTNVSVTVTPSVSDGGVKNSYITSNLTGEWSKSSNTFTCKATNNCGFTVKWIGNSGVGV